MDGLILSERMQDIYRQANPLPRKRPVSDNPCRELGPVEPELPPWEEGEIDEDGNRYWIIDFVK
jgi:hypothetical protein